MSKMNSLSRGVVVAVILAVITIVEYLVGTLEGAPVVLMVLFALLKAGLVLYFFMHIMRVFRSSDEGGHS